MKNKTTLYLLGGLLFLLIVTFLDATFIVHQTEQVLILQFGEPKRIVQTPGLKIKIPFLQNLIYYDNRLLDLDPDVEQLTLTGEKRLNVDSFTRYRIIDPLKFYQTVMTEERARVQLGNIINSSVRDVLGKIDLAALLSEERVKIMSDIKQKVDQKSKELGVEIVDVRIRRADLPDETSQSIYERMKANREELAKKFRGQGEEVAKKIRAEAERDQTILLTEAHKKSEIIKGEGDQKATKIWGDAAGRDPEFFAFYRSLEAYKKSLMNRNDTSFVLSPNSEFFHYFKAKN